MNPLAAYKENAVVTQPRGRIVVLLCDGAIKFIRQAIAAMEAGDIERRHELLLKAQAIIDELDASLNMEVGGQLATNLRALYDFMRRHLIAANVHKDPQRAREVAAILEDLNKGWRAIGA